MGKFVMSVALAAMLAGTVFLLAAPLLVSSGTGLPGFNAGLCVKAGIACRF